MEDQETKMYGVCDGNLGKKWQGVRYEEIAM